MMKYKSALYSLALAAALTAGLLSTPASAQQQQQMQNGQQMQMEQQACEGDVYALCGQAIPDQNRIAHCLRKNWKKVSHQCRKVMANYGKRHHSRSD